MSGDRAVGDDPEVSVVTIFRNEERHLSEAVESVLAQTGCRWELLLVDDGSNDASPAIARAFVEAHPDRIRYLTHGDGENRGMSASRNLGLAEARARWLTFLDADDVWLPGKLAAQLEALARHPEVEVLASPAQWWYRHPANTAGGEDWVQTLWPTGIGGSSIDAGPDEIVVQPPDLVAGFLVDEWRSICDLVVSRDVVEAVGGYDPMFRGMFEDQVFHAKVLARSPALVTARWWYRYRQHPDACTATSHRAGDHRAARRRFLRWLVDHLDDAGLAESELARAAQSEHVRARHPRLSRVASRVKLMIARP